MQIRTDRAAEDESLVPQESTLTYVLWELRLLSLGAGMSSRRRELKHRVKKPSFLFKRLQQPLAAGDKLPQTSAVFVRSDPHFILRNKWKQNTVASLLS